MYARYCMCLWLHLRLRLCLIFRRCLRRCPCLALNHHRCNLLVFFESFLQIHLCLYMHRHVRLCFYVGVSKLIIYRFRCRFYVCLPKLNAVEWPLRFKQDVCQIGRFNLDVFHMARGQRQCVQMWLNIE